ncbi:MAG: hypothetical protein P8075_17435 [Deltaproteobacteria bacterium]|jgi:hypothetical protein
MTLRQDSGYAAKNAPSFIYEILYGEPKFIPGRTAGHREKIWKGIPVDEHLPLQALDELDKIKEIELRASCEGSGGEIPTYLIFRFRKEPDEKQAATFTRAMNAIEDVKCGADIGNMGRWRFGMTASTPLWYEKDPERFSAWWRDLPRKILIALTTIRVLNQVRFGAM